MTFLNILKITCMHKSKVYRALLKTTGNNPNDNHYYNGEIISAYIHNHLKEQNNVHTHKIDIYQKVIIFQTPKLCIILLK